MSEQTVVFNGKFNAKSVLVAGKPASGKSASLMGIDNPRVLYLNCENGKLLPFRSKCKQVVVTDPLHIFNFIKQAEESGQFDAVVIDSLTFWFQMLESKYVIGSKNGLNAWQSFAQYFLTLMNDYVADSKMAFIFLAHTKTTYNEKELKDEIFVPVKGALANNGIEAFFTTVLHTRVMDVNQLQDTNALLNITDEDRARGVKYVFQTFIDAGTVGSRIRAPMGMWSLPEKFIDNDLGKVIHRINEYYSDGEETVS